MTNPLALIIEDDYDAAQIFAKALQVQGLQIEIIESGRQAMERLSEITPRLIVLDLHLPDIAGIELLEWVRSTDTLRDTVLLVVTVDAHLAEGLGEVADHVLLKPATFAQIRDLTTQLMAGQ